jgi:hypothetical protein
MHDCLRFDVLPQCGVDVSVGSVMLVAESPPFRYRGKPGKQSNLRLQSFPQGSPFQQIVGRVIPSSVPFREAGLITGNGNRRGLWPAPITVLIAVELAKPAPIAPGQADHGCFGREFVCRPRRLLFKECPGILAQTRRIAKSALIERPIVALVRLAAIEAVLRPFVSSIAT